MSEKYALIIANTEYSDPNLAQLSSPGKDAEELARVLKDKDIAAFDDVRVVINQAESFVREKIDEFFDLKKPDDLLLLYFSGHGVRDEMGALYLAVKNTSHTRLRSTAIRSDFVREAMDQSRSKRVVLILDCCNSGAFAQGTKAMTGGSVGTASAFEGKGYGRIVLTASDSTQFAWEGDKIIGGETENSLFTHYLVQGMEGEADRDGDGRITIDELYDYAYEQIVQRTPKQTPGKWSYKQQGDILLIQSLHPKHVKPVALPKDLVEAMEDSRTFVREGAVEQLKNIMGGKNPGLALSAHEAVKKIAGGDDSRRVVDAAKRVLESAAPLVGQEEIDQLKKRQDEDRIAKEKAEAEHKAKEKAEAARLRQKAEEDRITQGRIEAMRSARDKEKLERQAQPKLQVTATVEKFPPAAKQKQVKSPNMRIRFGCIVTLVLLILAIPITAKLSSPLLTTAPTDIRPTTVISPIALNTDTATPALAPGTHTPIPTDTSTSTPTKVAPSLTFTPAPAIPADPADFIRFYFDNINSRNYDLTWSLLSDAYKTKTNPDGINKYKDFWNSYSRIEITSVDYTRPASNSALTTLETIFYKSNSSAPYKLSYYLTWDTSRGTWLFAVMPAAIGSSTDTTCSTVPKRLSVGIQAKVVTATSSLLLRETSTEGAIVFEKMPPGTIVTVLEGPVCGLYRSVYFWWWKVQAPSGKVGWVVEGSDPEDLIFIQPTP